MSRPVAAYRQYWRPTWSAARLTPFPSAESSGHEPCAMTQDMRRTESDTDAVRQGMKVQSESHEPAVAGADLAVARRVPDVQARATSTLAGLPDGCFTARAAPPPRTRTPPSRAKGGP